MDKFTQHAFMQAEMRDAEREANAWKDISVEDIRSTELAALIACGIKEAATLINTAKERGLENTLRSYATHMMMGGFSIGFKAGRKSMLEGGGEL